MHALKALTKQTSQKAVAAQLGVTQAIVSHWLTGRKRITPDRAMAIELALGVPAESLCDSVQWLRDAAGKLLGYVVTADCSPVDCPEC